MSQTMDQRDAEIAEWNAAVATGNPELIQVAQTKLLTAIHTRIMNEDLNYRKAGWK